MRRQNRHRSATVRRPAAMWIAAGGWSNPAWLNVRALLRPGFTTALRQHSRPGKVSTPHPGPLLVWRGEGKTTAASLENRVAGQAASPFHQPAENPKEFRPKTEGCSVAAYPGYALFQPMDKLEEFCPASRETGRQAAAREKISCQSARAPWRRCRLAVPRIRQPEWRRNRIFSNV